MKDDYILSDSEYIKLDDELHALVGQFLDDDDDISDNDYQDMKYEVIKFIELRRNERV